MEKGKHRTQEAELLLTEVKQAIAELIKAKSIPNHAMGYYVIDKDAIVEIADTLVESIYRNLLAHQPDNFWAWVKKQLVG